MNQTRMENLQTALSAIETTGTYPEAHDAIAAARHTAIETARRLLGPLLDQINQLEPNLGVEGSELDRQLQRLVDDGHIFLSTKRDLMLGAVGMETCARRIKTFPVPEGLTLHADITYHGASSKAADHDPSDELFVSIWDTKRLEEDR